MSAKITAFFHEYLKEYHIPSSFEHATRENSVRVTSTEDLPIYFKVVNNSTEQLSSLFSLEKNVPLSVPIFESYLNGNSNFLLNEHHIISFNIVPITDFKLMGRIATKVNVILKSFFERRNLQLAEMVCTFGRCNDKIVLLGNFAPHTIKLLAKEGSAEAYDVSTPSAIKKYLELFQESVKS